MTRGGKYHPEPISEMDVYDRHDLFLREFKYNQGLEAARKNGTIFNNLVDEHILPRANFLLNNLARTTRKKIERATKAGG